MAVYNIKDYGAVPNTRAVCTEAVQAAIDACKDGDTVCIPKGVFVSGALFLKSNMTLFLEKGARLEGSGRIKDFPVMTYRFEGMEQLCYASLLNTDGAPHENITIDGEGIIDANGLAVFVTEMADEKIKRGRAVCIRNTEHVTVRGVEIRQSPAWCLHLIYCRDVLIEQIKVYTKYDEEGVPYGIHNGDGIDVDSCQNVRIANCLIESQDDCIAIKSGRNAEGRRVGIPSSDIVIENCSFTNGFGVAMGSEMSGGIENIYVRNCTFNNVFSIASIKAVRGRGGYVKNVHYENCSYRNENAEYGDTRYFRGAIYADGFYGEEEFDADACQEVDEGTPVVDGIYFKDITLWTIAGSENAVYLCGLPEAPFKNIFMENIKTHGKQRMKVKNIDNLQCVNVDIAAE